MGENSKVVPDQVSIGDKEQLSFLKWTILVLLKFTHSFHRVNHLTSFVETAHKVRLTLYRL